MTKKCHNEGGLDLIGNAATRFAALVDSLRCEHTAAFGEAWRRAGVALSGGGRRQWIDRELARRAGRPDGRGRRHRHRYAFPGDLECRNLEVLRHDITRDPMPEREFDLIHARMILIHLPERDAVLRRLAAALKPGGWLVCEEFDAVPAVRMPAVSPGEVSVEDPRRHATDSASIAGSTGGTAGCCSADSGHWDWQMSARKRTCRWCNADRRCAMLLRASYELRRRAMIDAGYVTRRRVRCRISPEWRDDFMMPSPIMWTAWGRRL